MISTSDLLMYSRLVSADRVKPISEKCNSPLRRVPSLFLSSNCSSSVLSKSWGEHHMGCWFKEIDFKSSVRNCFETEIWGRKDKVILQKKAIYVNNWKPHISVSTGPFELILDPTVISCQAQANYGLILDLIAVFQILGGRLKSNVQ